MMKITKDKLLTSDWDTMLTRDPATFFEAILINLLWNKDSGVKLTPEARDVIERQRYIFMQWHKYFKNELENDLRLQLKKDLQKETDTKLIEAYERGNKVGMIYALSNLPRKKHSKTVDSKAVAEWVKKLREPQDL